MKHQKLRVVAVKVKQQPVLRDSKIPVTTCMQPLSPGLVYQVISKELKNMSPYQPHEGKIY